MKIYQIPRRTVAVRLLLDDGRTLDGAMFTSPTGPNGQPEDVLRHMNDTTEEFVPLLGERESVLVNKARIIWIRLDGEAADEIQNGGISGRSVPVSLTLSGGDSLAGALSVVMPAERNRVVDFLNASGRFVPLFEDSAVTLVQKAFVASVRSAETGTPF